MFNRRTSDFIEQLKLLKPHKAGFSQCRIGGGTSSMASCIVAAKDEETLTEFVDIVTAYDNLSREALVFHKLENRLGLHGTTPRFLRALYASSCCRVRVGIGANAMRQAFQV
jgi:hypothetical protein